MKSNRLFASLAACSALFASCATGRVMSADEASMVGAEGAGSEVYNSTVRSVLQKCMDEHSQKFLHNADGKWAVALVDIDNKGAEEMGDFKEAVRSNLADVLINSEMYTWIDEEYVNAALNETRVMPTQLFLEEPRQKFLSVVGKRGKLPSVLLFARVTTQTTKGSKDILGRRESERTYQLELRFVDAQTGETVTSKKSDPVRKAYAK
jgi:hypothetical protein